MSGNNQLPSVSHFLEYRHWEEAVKLLNKQIELMEEGKEHFNTLSMRYYSSRDYAHIYEEEYFKRFIESELFYALSKRYRSYDYPKPKNDGVRIRRYKFLTYRLRVLHYAIGIYLMEVTKDFRKEYYGSIGRLKGKYGGDLSIGKDGRLNSIRRKNIYFWEHYKEFASEARNLIETNSVKRSILRFDISNYYDNISIDRLLKKILVKNKERENIETRFDSVASKIISEIYYKISRGEGGIPQTDNNIISSFIGNLYMIYADLLIDDIVRDHESVESHQLLRWVDDTYLSVDFVTDLDGYERDRVSTEIAQSVSNVLIEDMGLRVNPKTRLFRSRLHSDREKYFLSLLNTSMNEQFASEVLDQFNVREESLETDETNRFSYLRDYPKGTVEEIINVLNKLRHNEISKVGSDFSIIDEKSRDVLKMVYDDNVSNLTESDLYYQDVKSSLLNMDFSLIYLSKGPILTLILKFDDVTKQLEKYLLDKDELSLNDTWVSLAYLLKKGVPKGDLYDKVVTDAYFGDILSNVDGTNKFDKTGYYDIPLILATFLSDTRNAVYQIKNRKLTEIRGESSVAINYLLNEIHSVCFSLDQNGNEIKYYGAKEVISFLDRCFVPHELITSVRRLFDIRNLNPLSHPGSESFPSKILSVDEYYKIREKVGLCIHLILEKRLEYEIFSFLLLYKYNQLPINNKL